VWIQSLDEHGNGIDMWHSTTGIIETICSAHLGNYLVYFPPYAYLEQDLAMTEAEREAFLSQFSERLIGVVVVGVGRGTNSGWKGTWSKSILIAKPAMVLPMLTNIQVSTGCSRQLVG
jgi:hypothetical protein